MGYTIVSGTMYVFGVHASACAFVCSICTYISLYLCVHDCVCGTCARLVCWDLNWKDTVDMLGWTHSTSCLILLSLVQEPTHGFVQLWHQWGWSEGAHCWMGQRQSGCTLCIYITHGVCRTNVQFTVSVAQLGGENMYTYIQYITALSDCLNYLC